MQEIITASPNDANDVISFYHSVCDAMNGTPNWKSGIYPEDEHLIASIKNMLILKYNGKIAAAVILDHSAPDSYNTAKWRVNAAPNEFAVIHLLAVSPDFRGKGFAKTLLREAVNNAKTNGCKAIRLDVAENNISAVKLYENLGFYQCGKFSEFYERTGNISFLLYELAI